jgi:acetyl-CoA decarbonylase/synthase complex subunit gamma
MGYRVEPGLYAIGSPGGLSDVFVSANYKLSFDILRKALRGLDAWILVLETEGINVWCAAGKGTFGTAELVNRIRIHQIGRLVSHRRIVLPQLGAPGVESHVVQRMTGFRVHFGPVYARDIKEYVNAGHKARPEMRLVRFPFLDRLILAPMEFNPVMKLFPLYLIAVFIVFGLEPSGIRFREAWNSGLPFVLLGLAAVITGTVLAPVLLPFVPFRSFAIKGLVLGALTTFLCLQGLSLGHDHNAALASFSYLFFPALSSYLALQFTGATPFTSVSGVKKELKFALPLYVGAGVAAVIALALYKLLEWRVL